MELVLSVFIVAACATIVAAAPAFSESQGNILPSSEEKEQDYYRDKRSQYQVMSPCALAAASAPMPSISPPGYPVNLAPYHAYARSFYGMPQYRAVEFDPEETMGFSDMDQMMMPEHLGMARYGYAPAAHVPVSYAPPAAPSPVFAGFKANVGGCSIPLLVSCTPSVVQGEMQKAHYVHGDSYRGVEPISHHDSQEHRDPLHDQINPANHAAHQ